jgi:lipoprotein
MKKILCLLLLLTILTSCTKEAISDIPEEKSETQKYTV